jgi:osmoprotectant transport system ATP-binding protein
MDRRETEKRSMELLERVGLDPAFAKRYPAQLSGGQQQRVGVARALAADPPVMLMDEPFSAVDPVVREQLQDEFLRLQGELGKTIVFVTHDIDEAIKLGDQVAVLRVGGTLAQIAEPAYLLSHPVDDFTADFVGRDRGYRALSFQSTPRLPLASERTVAMGETVKGIDADWVLVVDEGNRPLGWVEPQRVAGDVTTEVLHRGGTVARAGGPLRAALDAALSSPSRRGVIVDDAGSLVGTVLAHEVLTAIEQTDRPELEDPHRPGVPQNSSPTSSGTGSHGSGA